jgi:hypothetical protein
MAVISEVEAAFFFDPARELRYCCAQLRNVSQWSGCPCESSELHFYWYVGCARSLARRQPGAR